MTNFGKTSLIWLLAGSLVAASGVMAWRVAAVGAKQAQDALQQVDKSEADLAALKTRLAQWQKAHPPGSLGSKGIIRIEPVALTADFAPREFPGIGKVLGGMYTENGSLKLKSFNLELGAGAGTGIGAGAGTMHLTVLGDKVFMQ